MAAPVILARAAAAVIPFLKRHPWLIPFAIVVPIVVGIYVTTLVGGAVSGLASVSFLRSSECVSPQEGDAVFWENDKELNDALQACEISSQVFAADGEWVWPVAPEYAMVTSPWGNRYLNGEWKFHDAVDLNAPYGAEIYAASNGKVIEAEYGNGQPGFCSSAAFPTGAGVKIDNGNGIKTWYYHIMPKVKVGDIVKPGQVIGIVGNYGFVCGAHLHFSIIKDGSKPGPDPEVWYASIGKPFR